MTDMMTKYDPSQGALIVPLSDEVRNLVDEYFDKSPSMETIDFVGVFGNTVHQFIDALVEALKSDDSSEAVNDLMTRITGFDRQA